MTYRKQAQNQRPALMRRRPSRGATLTGYGLIVGLIAIVGLAATTSIGSSVDSLFVQVGDEMADVVAETSGGGTVPASTPEATPTPQLYAVFAFDGNFNNTGSGSDVTVQSFGTTTAFSTAQVFEGSHSLFVDSTDSGDNNAHVLIDLPQLLNSNDWEIRIRAWQNDAVNDENFPSIAYFGYNTSLSMTSNSWYTYRWGPSADLFGTYIARDSSGNGDGLSDIRSFVTNQSWAELVIAYDNGVAELRANGTTLTSRNIDLVNYPFGNSTLSLGHFPGLNSDNGYEGHIDRVEVEIFD